MLTSEPVSQGPYLPGYEAVDGPRISYGITRLDHAVGNVPNLLEAVRYISGFTGSWGLGDQIEEALI